jgi:hypothetical protein
MELFSPRVWLSILLASAIGFGAGYGAKGKMLAAAEVTQGRKTIAAGADSIVASVVASNKLEAKVSTSNFNMNEIKAAIDQHGITLSQNPQEIHNGIQDCGSFTLDSGTVSLLNAARQGGTLGSVSGGNEALDAASTVTISKFVDNDLDVVKLYHELAARHDQLVDEVEQKLSLQAQ